MVYNQQSTKYCLKLFVWEPVTHITPSVSGVYLNLNYITLKGTRSPAQPI